MSDRRCHLRVQISQPALYYKDASPRPRVGTAVDLSTEGASVETPYSLTKGEAVDISIALGQRVFRCRAKVVYALGLENDRLKAGLEFGDISNEDRLVIEQYLASLSPWNSPKTN